MKGYLEWFYFKVQTAEIIIEQIPSILDTIVSEK